MEVALVVLIVALITIPVVIAAVLVLTSSLRNSRSKDMLSSERSVSTEVGATLPQTPNSPRLRDLVIENLRKKRKAMSASDGTSVSTSAAAFPWPNREEQEDEEVGSVAVVV